MPRDQVVWEGQGSATKDPTIMSLSSSSCHCIQSICGSVCRVVNQWAKGCWFKSQLHVEHWIPSCIAAATHLCVSVCVNGWMSGHFKNHLGYREGAGKHFISPISLPVYTFIARPYTKSHSWSGRGVLLCERGPVLFQLPPEQGGVLKGEKINLPMSCVFLRVSIWDGGLPNMRAAQAAYASLGVDIPRSICHLSVKRTRPSVFAAKREPRLRSHSLLPPLVFLPGVRQNHEVFYKSWLRRSRLRVPSGSPLPVRARAHASFGMGLESFRALAAPETQHAFTLQGSLARVIKDVSVHMCPYTLSHVWLNIFTMNKIWPALHLLHRSKHKRGCLHYVSIGTVLEEQTNCAAVLVFSLRLWLLVRRG